MDLQEIRDSFDSVESKQFFEKIKNRRNIQKKQLKRIKISGKFKELIEKAIVKYNSDKYREKWYKLGIEPPELLFWTLFDYAEKYGRKCKQKEFKKYGNMFTTALFFCDGYYFNRMDGQGSAIEIYKSDDMLKEKFHTIKITIPKNMSNEESKLVILNSFYKLGQIIYETEGEFTGKLKNNGHHIAQTLAENAYKLWEENLTLKK